MVVNFRACAIGKRFTVTLSTNVYVSLLNTVGFSMINIALVFYVSHQWLETKFLPYLDKWEESVNQRGFKPCELKRMLLSQETLLGLRMPGKVTNCNGVIMCY